MNCEVLSDDPEYEVRWAVTGDKLFVQLVAKLENNEYMSFGISGDKDRSRMVGGDVVVAWVDKDTFKGHAVDYYLDAKSQCSGGRGSCPDENIIAGAESVKLLDTAIVNGYSIVTYKRTLKSQDELDKPVLTNTSQPVIWAIGPLNSRKEVSYHSLANREDIFIDFGRYPKYNCPVAGSGSDQSEEQDTSNEHREVEATNLPDSGNPEGRVKARVPTPAPAPKSGAWDIPAIKCDEPDDGVFYAQMGPTGGKRGYSAITGHVGWGISWYINGLLIPEINVVRGRTYTFIVEGGLDPEIPARYHPFYITDDPVGGYQYKTPQERANIQIFAGAVQNKKGEVRPTGVGRLCNWTPDPNQPPADEFTSFGAYQRTLRLECDPGNPGIIQWTVDKDTPDTVYYQCYTHRYLGWKINVHDRCDGAAASSNLVPSIVKSPQGFLSKFSDPAGSESINHEVRIKPDGRYLEVLFEKNQTAGLNEFSAYKDGPILKYRESQNRGATVLGEASADENSDPISFLQEESFELNSERHDRSENYEVNRLNNDTIARAVKVKNILEVMETLEEADYSPPQKKSLPVEGKFPNKGTMEDEVAMADEKTDFYLPPKLNRFLSYDGKMVKADLAPPLTGANAAADLYKLPQFVPFRGAIPPLGEAINVMNLPQLRTSKLARLDILPPPEAKPSNRRTSSEGSHSQDSLNSQGVGSKAAAAQERRRRSPDHIPGHEGHGDDGHNDHHHHHHHNSSYFRTPNALLLYLLIPIVFSLLA